MKIRNHMITRIICLVVVSAFLANEFCYGLGIQPASVDPAKKEEIINEAHGKFWAMMEGKWVLEDTFKNYNSPKTFVGTEFMLDTLTGKDILKESGYDIEFIEDHSKLPEGWENNPVLQEKDTIKALEMIRDRAGITKDQLEIKEGWFPYNKEKGEIPVDRIELLPNGKYVMIVHTEYVQKCRYVKEHDVLFKINLKPGDKNTRRTVSVANGLLYRPAYHAMTVLSKHGEFKSHGHFMPSTNSTHRDEDMANLIGGNYSLTNNAIWMWNLGSFCFNDVTRYDNEMFDKRTQWFFESSVAKQEGLDREFPDLINNPAELTVAQAIAHAINYNFFNRPDIKVPDTSVDQKLVDQATQREEARKKAGMTEQPVYATGGPDNGQQSIQTDNIEEIKAFLSKVAISTKLELEKLEDGKKAAYSYLGMQDGNVLLLSLSGNKSYTVSLSNLAKYKISFDTTKTDSEATKADRDWRPDSPLTSLIEQLAKAAEDGGVEDGEDDGSSKLDELVAALRQTSKKSEQSISLETGVRTTDDPAANVRGKPRYLKTPNKTINMANARNKEEKRVLVMDGVEKEFKKTRNISDSTMKELLMLFKEADLSYSIVLWKDLINIACSFEYYDVITFFDKTLPFQAGGALFAEILRGGRKDWNQEWYWREIFKLLTKGYIPDVRNAYHNKDIHSLEYRPLVEALNPANKADVLKVLTAVKPDIAKAFSGIVDYVGLPKEDVTPIVKTALNRSISNSINLDELNAVANAKKWLLSGHTEEDVRASKVRTTSDPAANVRGKPRYLKTPEENLNDKTTKTEKPVAAEFKISQELRETANLYLGLLELIEKEESSAGPIEAFSEKLQQGFDQSYLFPGRSKQAENLNNMARRNSDVATEKMKDPSFSGVLIGWGGNISVIARTANGTGQRLCIEPTVKISQKVVEGDGHAVAGAIAGGLLTGGVVGAVAGALIGNEVKEEEEHTTRKYSFKVAEQHSVSPMAYLSKEDLLRISRGEAIIDLPEMEKPVEPAKRMISFSGEEISSEDLAYAINKIWEQVSSQSLVDGEVTLFSEGIDGGASLRAFNVRMVADLMVQDIGGLKTVREHSFSDDEFSFDTEIVKLRLDSKNHVKALFVKRIGEEKQGQVKEWIVKKSQELTKQNNWFKDNLKPILSVTVPTLVINPLTERVEENNHNKSDAGKGPQGVQTTDKDNFSEEQERAYIRGLFEDLLGKSEQPDGELTRLIQEQDQAAANEPHKDSLENQYKFLKKNEVDWLFVVAYLRAMNGEMGDRDKAVSSIKKAAELLRTTEADISDHKIWDTTIFEMAIKALSILIDDGHGTQDMKVMLQALKTNNSMKKALGWKAPVYSEAIGVKMTSDLPANVRGEPRYLKTPEALTKSKTPLQNPIMTQGDNSIVNEAIRWGAKIPSDKRVIEAINYKTYNYILLLLASDSASNGTEDITAMMITKDGKLNKAINIGTRSETDTNYTCLASFDGRFMVLSNCENGNSYKELCNIYDMGNTAASPISLEKPMWIRFNKARTYVVFARTGDYSANATRPNKIYIHDLYGTSPEEPMIVEDYDIIDLETAPGSSVEPRKIGIESDAKPELLVPVKTSAVASSDLIEDVGLSELHAQNEEALKDHPFIKVISEYIIQTCLGNGPGNMNLSAMELNNIDETIGELQNKIIEIYIPKGFKLTEKMGRAIKDIGKRSGRGEVICREYEHADHLAVLLNKPSESGADRIALVDDKNSEKVLDIVANNPDAFRSARMLNISLPENYYKMNSIEKTALQTKFITIAILARLLEKDSTPMVEALLRDMLKTCPGFNESSMASFIDALGVSDRDVAAMDARALIERITNMLGKPIKLVEKIGREIYLMKNFWIAA